MRLLNSHSIFNSYRLTWSLEWCTANFWLETTSRQQFKSSLKFSILWNAGLLFENHWIISRWKKRKNLTKFFQPHSNNRSPRYSKNCGKRTFRSKEEFLQSTAQFLVRSDSELELAPFGVDSDIPVPWKFIEAVRLFGQDRVRILEIRAFRLCLWKIESIKISNFYQEATECPICLHPPVAGKVGRCGHAHCASCVLKLIAISEYPECPICQCHIKIQDRFLKS